MNAYQKLQKELEDSRCKQCNRRGICDDFGIGDTFYNEWTCKDCRGTGLDRNSQHYKNMVKRLS